MIVADGRAFAMRKGRALPWSFAGYGRGPNPPPDRAHPPDAARDNWGIAAGLPAAVAPERPGRLRYSAIFDRDGRDKIRRAFDRRRVVLVDLEPRGEAIAL